MNAGTLSLTLPDLNPNPIPDPKSSRIVNHTDRTYRPRTADFINALIA